MGWQRGQRPWMQSSYIQVSDVLSSKPISIKHETNGHGIFENQKPFETTMIQGMIQGTGDYYSCSDY